MNSKEIISKEEKYLLKTYKKLPIAIVKGTGMTVRDSSGKKYLDFYGGHAAALTGHCHPNVVKAIKKQAEKLIFYSNLTYNDVRAETAELIVKLFPKTLNKVFFSNSGSEGNEVALKIAKKFAGKKEVISMKDSFHGRTLGALSATGIKNYSKPFKPLVPGFKFAEFGNIDSLNKLISKKTAAVIIEPIQSVGGVKMASAEYYKELREICEKKNIALIFDEVQTGFGRTGKMFFGEHYKVVPDIITLAKGIASGFPMAATIVNENIAETIGFEEHGSTFGGNPLACAAAKASIETILGKKLVKNAKEMGKYLDKELNSIQGIEEITGLGLLKGIWFKAQGKEIQGKLLAKGFVLGGSIKPNNLRLMPPLIIGKNEINALSKALKEILGGEKCS